MFLYRNNPDIQSLQYPIYLSPKIDGIRGIIVNGELRSRTLKKIPNEEVFAALSRPELNGFDGELVYGKPTDERLCGNTNSLVMSIRKTPVWENFYYYVFDNIEKRHEPFSERYKSILERINNLPDDLKRIVKVVPHRLVTSPSDLLMMEDQYLEMGYEGVVLRNPNSLYKENRTTLRDNNAFKLKRFQDSECLIVGMEEEMHNTNAQEVNELGNLARSKRAEGLIGKATMGAVICKDISDPRFADVTFKISGGVGIDHALRKEMWENQHNIIGKQIWKYKFFNRGIKDKPRHPKLVSERNPIDM